MGQFVFSRVSGAISVLLALVAFPVSAGDLLPDILKNPTYLASWNRLIASQENNEPWLKRYSEVFDGPTVPSSHVTLSDGTYTITWVCQAHNCGFRRFCALFAPDGKDAWGILLKDTRDETLFGAPDEEKSSAIRRYLWEN